MWNGGRAKMTTSTEEMRNRLQLMERAVQIFWMERLVYMGVSVGAVGLLAYTVVRLVGMPQPPYAMLIPIVGSGGSLVFCISRLLKMWNDVLGFLQGKAPQADSSSHGGK